MYSFFSSWINRKLARSFKKNILQLPQRNAQFACLGPTAIFCAQRRKNIKRSMQVCNQVCRLSQCEQTLICPSSMLLHYRRLRCRHLRKRSSVKHQRRLQAEWPTFLVLSNACFVNSFLALIEPKVDILFSAIPDADLTLKDMPIISEDNLREPKSTSEEFGFCHYCCCRSFWRSHRSAYSTFKDETRVYVYKRRRAKRRMLERNCAWTTPEAHEDR